MKLKFMSLLISLFTVMFLVMTEPVSISAFDSDLVPDIDENLNKSLTVYFYVEKLGVPTPIDGAEIGIYKIAGLETKNGSASYSVTESYSSLAKISKNRDITFEGISFSESVEFAKSFEEIAKKEQPLKTAVTNSDGICRFDALEQGMYLVRELSKTGTAEKYQSFAAYMISVPFPESHDGLNEWQYDVLSEPKTKISSGSGDEISKDTSDESRTESSEPSDSSIIEISKHTSDTSKTDSSQPQSSSPLPIFTGDSSSSMVIALLGICFASLAAVLALNHKKKGADENE